MVGWPSPACTKPACRTGRVSAARGFQPKAAVLFPICIKFVKILSTNRHACGRYPKGMTIPLKAEACLSGLKGWS
ncbi:hypothetical protein CO087_00535 [Candidatus Wolfebacteria bacterium CG_4_9_14_0_8_um_filter_39_46]|uniref:Uncharacterized protein n=2 Tax=Candidatus Wolfeibacteriota TaxID=1752735 RepID=A0A2M7Q6U2_9BACT|nr:MAG: hypothetical protein COY97_00510 [Candidatus Wolfebacteria bacterium CG_4_10_14_0_8_um_filter_39_64]PJB84116.1 MAG: hypothetical protein CO087_00535 [Candidatus Wolfebacteria bacterium CG_4_9_14_0_8_um_filter_39_46]